MTDFHQSTVNQLKKEQEEDIKQINRYTEMIREIEARISNRSIAMNHLEKL